MTGKVGMVERSEEKGVVKGITGVHMERSREVGRSGRGT